MKKYFYNDIYKNNYLLVSQKLNKKKFDYSLLQI